MSSEPAPCLLDRVADCVAFEIVELIWLAPVSNPGKRFNKNGQNNSAGTATRVNLSAEGTAAPLSCDLIGRSLAEKWAWKWIGSIRK
ncbi:hypothetical protein TNCV_3615081 [Trichonephila clavipes]|nr:hypothetical protein TNCV_3615081 [Trichonephila clavipes]